MYLYQTCNSVLLNSRILRSGPLSRLIVLDLDEHMEQEKAKRPLKNDDDLDKYHSLEKHLQAMERSNKFFLDVKSLWLVSSLVILLKCLILKKYNGTTDPTTHLHM